MHSVEQKDKDASTKVTPNILPCNIQLDGPVTASERYWNPSISEDGKNMVHFRGRKLTGKAVPVPEGYQGVVLQPSSDPEADLRARQNQVTFPEIIDVDEESEQQDSFEVKPLAVASTFDEIMVWSHDAPVDADSDVYMRAAAELTQFAHSTHSFESEETTTQ